MASMLQSHITITLGAGEIDAATILSGIVGVAIGAIGAFFVLRMLSGQTLARAKTEAQTIRERAETDSQTIKSQAEVAAERFVIERKEKFEIENESVRKELRETERRHRQREDLLDKKLDTLTMKEDYLTKSTAEVQRREKAAQVLEQEVAAVLLQQKEKLVQVAQMTVEEARREVFQRVEEDSRMEMAKIVHKQIAEAESESKRRAQEITLMAIQRYAAEHTAESTVRAVPIPSDDMKGRIIGREGRNIRAIEKATGVDIIVDDTPGVIVVSCFDKIRQAVAVEALQRLVADGRMHPSRIEEVVEKVKGEIQEKVLKAGKEAVMEVNLRGLHPKIVEAMGKMTYRTSYGQNVLRHSVEVAMLCQIIADQLGLDGAIARRCGFLHDIGKAMDEDMEGTHPKIGMDFAKLYGEKDPVLNAIAGHHGDVPSTSFYTPIVMAADAVSSARPGARRESMEKYIQRLQGLQDIAMQQVGVVEAYAIQAGREVRVMVDAKRVNDDEAQLIAYNIAKKVSEEMTFPGEIRVTVLRETRAVEFAR